MLQKILQEKACGIDFAIPSAKEQRKNEQEAKKLQRMKKGGSWRLKKDAEWKKSQKSEKQNTELREAGRKQKAELEP